MTIQQLQLGKELESKMKGLKQIYDIMNVPHPILIADSEKEARFITLGTTMEAELKKLIIKFVEEKTKELDKEFKEL